MTERGSENRKQGYIRCLLQPTYEAVVRERDAENRSVFVNEETNYRERKEREAGAPKSTNEGIIQ